MRLSDGNDQALTPRQQERHRLLQEKDHREYLRDWEARQKEVDGRVKDLEQRVQIGPDGYTPPSN